MTTRPARVIQAEIERAIRAFKKHYGDNALFAIEIAADGAVRVYPCDKITAVVYGDNHTNQLQQKERVRL